MQCPKCQFKNPADSNFCLECGQKLEQKCPKCEKSLPVGAKFCNGCGNKVIAAPMISQKNISIEEKLDRIQRYLPESLVEKIISKKTKIEGERRQVTIMFCDLKGFTPLTETLGPDETFSLMDQVFEILVHKVNDYQGTVNELRGDGILAFFGAPIALEDAPQRAIRSALTIHREMTKFNDKVKENKNIPPILLRIGINTGTVVVGTMGNDLRVQFTAVGDSINMASRMESLAEPGTTYVTEKTFKLTEGFFRFEALGAKKIKGKEQPLNVYRVIAPSNRRTRFDVSAERGLTPLIGRGRQLELMLDGFERAKSGRGQVFSILSEAGVGKSRLLYEFRKAISNDNANFFEGKCLSYNRDVAYHPIVDLFKSNFDIRGKDRDSEITLKVKSGLKKLGINEASTLPYLLELLSVKDSGIEQMPISQEAMQEKLIEAVIQIPLKGSEKRPLIMAIEDIHWIDKSSQDILNILIESISGARILLIFTFRPEFSPTWGRRSYHYRLNLDQLSNRESLKMAGYLLDTKDIDRELEKLILDKTEGNPFFIEELITSLKDLKFIERKEKTYHLTKYPEALSIPSTIQDILMARIDSLPEKSKVVLQAGSVIGREFGYKLIKKVTKLSEQELLSSLSIFKDAELLYERGIFPHLTFIFRHALTRDAAYQSLLKKTRKKYHGEIARVLEKHFPKTAELQPELLGLHFTEADLFDKAVPYWLKAGEIAIRRSANIEAISHLNRGLDLLKSLSNSSKPECTMTELKLQIALGNAMTATKGYADPDVGKTFNRARVLCLQEDESSQLFQVLHGLARFHIVRTELQKTQELGEQLLCLAQQHKDSVLLLSAHQLLGTALWFMGKFTIAHEQFKLGIAYYDPNQHSSYIHIADEDQGVVCNSYMAWNLWLLGYPDQAMNLSRKALSLAQSLSHPLSLVFALNYAAITHQCRQEGRETQKQAEAAVSLAKDQGFAFWTAFGEMFLGWALTTQDKTDDGIALLLNSFTAWQATGANLAGSYFRAMLAEAYVRTKNVEAGLDVVSEAIDVVNNSEECIWEAELYRLKGELQRMDGESEFEVEKSFKQALQISKHQCAKSLELRSTLSLSRLWKRQGNSENARKILKEIITSFTEGFDTPDLKEAKSFLYEIS